MQSEIFKYDQFTYWSDENNYTIIGDYDCNIIFRFYNKVSEEVAQTYCKGYRKGYETGREVGRRDKENEFKKVLGI